MVRRQPVQQAPPVQRLRLRYAKRGRARFTSHRDFSRAFERSLRRADIPMAYTSGFSPHPRISYANASPTGAATEAEYLEIGLSAHCDPELVRGAIDNALPPGLDVLEVVVATRGALADRLTGSRWRIDLVASQRERIREAVEKFLAAESVDVERMTKNGIRTFDARGAVVELRVLAGADEAGPETLELVTRHLAPLVRPDDVLQAMQSLVPEFDPSVRLLLRAEQGILSGNRIEDPLAEPIPE